MNQLQLTIMPVGMCNMSCPDCTQTPWRKDYGEYQMLLEEVRRICERVGELGLHFTWAHITGGEPSLWDNLFEGCEILHNSGVFDHVEVWSNCKYIQPLVEVLEEGSVEQVITQEANACMDGANTLKRVFGDRMNIIPSQGHQVHPDGALDGVLPAECGCDRVAVFKGRVYPCANFYSNMKRIGGDVDGSTLCFGIEEDWKKGIDGVDRYNMQACRGCLANGKVSRQMPVRRVR